MTKSVFLQFTFGGMVIAAMYAVPAQAATRTWVSGNGNDNDPCSFTAPCKTFAGAISKTDPGGEVSVMNSGAYGAVTITKAVTINGEGNLASVLASGGTGITVAAGASDRVILRNLHFNGTGGGTSGIYISSAGSVTIDNCFIYGFTTGFFGGTAVNVAASASVQVDMRNTSITNSSFGFLAQTSSGFVTASLDNVRMNDMTGYGIGALSSGVFVSVRNSFIKNAGSAAINASGPSSQINVDHSELTNSGTAVSVTGSGATVRLNDNSIYNNTTDLSISNGGTVATANNNKTGGNGAGSIPNGSVGNL
jgi:hypothetical protein